MRFPQHCPESGFAAGTEYPIQNTSGRLDARLRTDSTNGVAAACLTSCPFDMGGCVPASAAATQVRSTREVVAMPKAFDMFPPHLFRSSSM
jgi:hypothetical protein